MVQRAGRHVAGTLVAILFTASWLCQATAPRTPAHDLPRRIDTHTPAPKLVGSRAAAATFAPEADIPPVDVAPAVPPPATAQADPLEKRRTAILALIAYPWQDLGYKIEFLGPRPGYRAMTISDKRRIEIYVRPGDSVESQAFDLAHEIGHAFDLERNNSERRKKWRELRGIDAGTPWFGCNRCPDYATPAGDFAETFAYLLLGPGSYHSRLGAPPTAAQISVLAEFCRIERAQTATAKRDSARPGSSGDTAGASH